jgi:hypothetical protein
MAVAFLPIIKAVAPILTEVAAATIPKFTSKPAEPAKVDPVVAKQIQELQEASTQNAQSLHALAANLKDAIQEIESAASEVKKQVAAYRLMLLVSLALSTSSILVCLWVLTKGAS